LRTRDKKDKRYEKEEMKYKCVKCKKRNMSYNFAFMCRKCHKGKRNDKY